MSEIKTWKERLQNPIYGYPEEMQCREDEVDELRTRIYQLEQELAEAKAMNNVREESIANYALSVTAYKTTIDAYEIKLAEAKKDQARYQWLRDPDNHTDSSTVCVSDDIFNMYFLDDLDEAIDAAIKESK